jgi:capsid protein
MSSSVTATTVGFVFGIKKASDNMLYFSQRVTGSRMAAQNDRTNTSGGGFVENLEAGDELSMWVAADKTATVTLYDLNIGLEMAIAAGLK